jgi:hypothetical protein
VLDPRPSPLGLDGTGDGEQPVALDGVVAAEAAGQPVGA